MKRLAGWLTCLVLLSVPTRSSVACCSVSRAVDRVVNADQTVIILWDADSKRQHFIRQASFKSDATEDIGFIVPSPSRPDLEEAGDEAFAQLKIITAPVVYGSGGGGLGCSATAPQAGGLDQVVVLERKRVAGFDAVVLTAGTAEALVDWLAENDYAYSDAVAAWAEPYVKKGWPFTALKVAQGEASGPDRSAAALRISFQTDTPLFPYREPDSAAAAKELGAAGRLLRIYFIAEQAYEGRFDSGGSWTGKKVWSGDITAHRADLVAKLKLPGSESGPKQWWLTEIEDRWPYRKAPGDVVFAPASDQKSQQRAGLGTPYDPLPIAVMVVALGMFLRRKRSGQVG